MWKFCLKCKCLKVSPLVHDTTHTQHEARGCEEYLPLPWLYKCSFGRSTVSFWPISVAWVPLFRSAFACARVRDFVECSCTDPQVCSKCRMECQPTRCKKKWLSLALSDVSNLSDRFQLVSKEAEDLQKGFVPGMNVCTAEALVPMKLVFSSSSARTVTTLITVILYVSTVLLGYVTLFSPAQRKSITQRLCSWLAEGHFSINNYCLKGTLLTDKRGNSRKRVKWQMELALPFLYTYHSNKTVGGGKSVSVIYAMGYESFLWLEEGKRRCPRRSLHETCCSVPTLNI